MVRSIIDLTIRYPELKGIDPEDEDYDAPVYEIDVFGNLVEVSVGRPKNAFAENELTYYPVYLVKKNKVVSQIGVYEVLNSDLEKHIDNEGEPDLKGMKSLLMYDFVDKELIEKNSIGLTATIMNKRVGKHESEYDEIDYAEGDDNGASDGKGKEEAPVVVKAFDKSKADNWVQVYMRNMDYGIKDNEGGGDCFFSAIRDGLATIGKTVTVMELRNRLSNAATPEIYQQYRKVYDELVKEYEGIDARIKQQTEEAKKIKTDVAKVTNRSEKAKLLLRASEIRDALKGLRDEKLASKQILGEFKWIAKLNTFPKFVKAIRTCSFWADDWATSIMERLYNIKVIIFSEANYEEGDLNNVLQCGRGDDELLEKGMFRPTEYIMMAHTGGHYKLITHSGKGAFTFNELPRDVVDLVQDKCMERNAGLYAIIPEFKNANANANGNANGNGAFDEDYVEEPSNLQLYNEGTILQFYDNAAVKPAPGKGSGELLGAEGAAAYKSLQAISDWRRRLAHGYEKQIKLDNHVWKTVEHYMEAQKYAEGHPDFYAMFSLDSGSEIADNLEMAKAAAAGKKYEGKTLRPKGVKPDDDWDSEKESEALKKALQAKFADAEMAKLLAATRNAKLVYYRKGKPARVEVEMMRIRKDL